MSWRKSAILDFCQDSEYTSSLDIGHKLNVHKTFRRRSGRFLNVLCTLNLRPLSMGSESNQFYLEWRYNTKDGDIILISPWSKELKDAIGEQR